MKHKETIYNSLIFLSGTLVAFFIAESFTRIFIKPIPSFELFLTSEQSKALEQTKNSSRETTIVTHSSPLGMSYFTPWGSGRFYPNIKGLIKSSFVSGKDIPFITNSMGLPDREPSDSDKYRILFLGDSIIRGDYTPPELRIPQVMQETLRVNFNHKEIAVFNGGVGPALRDHLLVFSEVQAKLQPKIVVVGLYLNDAHDMSEVSQMRFHAPAQFKYSQFLTTLAYWIEMWRHSSKYEKTANRGGEVYEGRRRFMQENQIVASSDWKLWQQGFNNLILESFYDWGNAWSGKSWEIVENYLTKFQAEVARNNVKLVVVLFPVRYQVESSYLDNRPQQAFNQIVQKLNIESVDLLPYLRDLYSKEKENIYYDHCHYTDKYSILLGQFLAEKINKVIQ